MFFRLLIVCLVALGLGTGQNAFAGAADAKLAVSGIPEELRRDATAVVRDNTCRIFVNSLTNVTVIHHFIVTVLNKDGNFLANFENGTSRICRIRKMEGHIYDKDGNRVAELDSRDFSERPHIEASAAAYSDLKDVFYNNTYHKYPYTVEYYWQEECKYSLVLPEWLPLSGLGIALQEAHLTVNYPAGLKINYQAFNMVNALPQASSGKEAQVLEWTVSNVHAVRAEPMSYFPDWHFPEVLLSLEQFRLDDYEGSAESWKTFGRFFYTLDSGRDVLPEAAKAEMKALVQSASSPEEKVRKLYAYLQHNTRYVLLRYGIGGWQSLEASFVHQNKYGDCKALSNYMKSLLKAVDITAYPVLIYGANGGDCHDSATIVGALFNHEILCVPLGKDTIFLECTDNAIPLGYLGTFTQNRRGLMITPDGGVLMHTPVYGADFNQARRRVEVQVDSQLRATAWYTDRYGGIFSEYIKENTAGVGEQKVKDFLNRKLGLPSYEVTGYHIGQDEQAPLAEEQLQVVATGMAGRTGKYLSLKTDYLSPAESDPEEDAGRTLRFRIVNSRSYCDTSVIRFPEGYVLDNKPADLVLDLPFGHYESRLEGKGNSITIYRTLKLQAGVYAREQYAAYAAFFQQIHEHTRKEVLLRKG